VRVPQLPSPSLDFLDGKRIAWLCKVRRVRWKLAYLYVEPFQGFPYVRRFFVTTVVVDVDDLLSALRIILQYMWLVQVLRKDDSVDPAFGAGSVTNTWDVRHVLHRARSAHILKNEHWSPHSGVLSARDPDHECHTIPAAHNVHVADCLIVSKPQRPAIVNLDYKMCVV
jgi:hypothetical protein